MINCCKINSKTKKCFRRDGKVFNLPRRFTKKQCAPRNVRGFSMRSSCAPFKNCFSGGERQFLYNPNNPKTSFDVYINKNPNDTIPIKYTTVDDVKKTIRKLERLFKNKKYPHKRIWQVGMIMKVRLEAMKKHRKKFYPNAKNVGSRFNLSNRYFKFLKKRTKKKTFKERRQMVFKFD